MTWLAIKAFLRGIPSWVWLAIAIAGSVWFYGHLRYNAGQAEVQAKFDTYKLHIQAEIDTQRLRNEAKEKADKAEFERIAKQYQKDKLDAQAKSDAVIAGLRAGTIKLRKQWQGCRTASQGAGDSQGTDESAGLRETGSGDLVRIGSEADSQVKRLQEGWQQCEKRYDP